MTTCPPNQPCFCPTADLPLSLQVVPQGGPGTVIVLPIFGTQPFSVQIVSNPVLPITQLPLIASVQVLNGNELTITTVAPDPTETLGTYNAQLTVCNACGTLIVDISIEVVADITPIVSNCLLAQSVWTPEARIPTVGDTLLAFTPAGCRALLPPPDTCTAIQGFPGAVPDLNTRLVTNTCETVSVLDILALYDLCTALNTFPAGAPPSPVDRIITLQGASCVTTTFAQVTAAVEANIDICTLLQNLPNAVVQPTAAFYGQQGGQCFEFLVADLFALLPPVTFPLLAPDGSCAAPSYSFTSSPDSGMFYFGDRVRISDDNCDDFIDVGASINLVSTSGAISTSAGTDVNLTANGGDVNIVSNTSDVLVSAGGGQFRVDAQTNVHLRAVTGFAALEAVSGAATIDAATTVTILTSGASRLAIQPTGAWNVSGTPGVAGQRLTSNGPGASPTWQAQAPPSFPLLAPNGSCAAPSYSFTSSPDSGMFYDAGAGTVIIGDDNCVDFIEVGASINLNAATGINLISPASIVAVVAVGGQFQVTTGQVSINSSAATSITAATTLSLRTAATNRFQIDASGAWNIPNGSPGVAGQVITSGGPGTPPTWTTPAAAPVPLNDVQDATGSATRNHGVHVIDWQFDATNANAFILRDPTDVRFNLGPFAYLTGRRGDGEASINALSAAGGIQAFARAQSHPTQPNVFISATVGATNSNIDVRTVGIQLVSNGSNGILHITDRNTFRGLTAQGQFMVGPYSALFATGNLLRVDGTANGGIPVLAAEGASDANVSMNLLPKGTGNIQAPNGSCAAPMYSFTASPDSGMFYDPAGVGSVVIGDDNCADSIAIGASITMRTNNVTRLILKSTGAWEIGGSEGVAGQVLTSGGPGVPPTFAAVVATVSFPLRAPTTATPQFSFTAQTGMGVAMDGAQVHFGSLDTVSPVWSVSSRLSIDIGATGDMFLIGSRGDGARGANLLIQAGNAVNPGVQVEGGQVQVLGGNSSESSGGNATVSAGSSSVASGGGAVGGNLDLFGGNGNQTPGRVRIATGASSNTFYAGGGNIVLRTDAYRAGTGPSVQIDHRNSQPYGFNCVFEIPGTPATPVRWAGLTGDTFANDGQSFQIRAGISANILNTGRGGDMQLFGGNAFGNGNQAGGQLTLDGGSASGTGVRGYVQLPRVTVSPTVAPNAIAGFAPLVLFDDGANIHLVAWCQSAGAWQTV